MAASSDEMIVGIDLGTATTVVAFGWSEKQDLIGLVAGYPNITPGKTDAICPTEILYEAGGRIRIGHEIRSDEPRHQFFKLDLNENRGYEMSYVAKRFPDAMRKDAPTGKTAKDMVTDFLREVHKYAMPEIRSRFRTIVDTTRIRYVLTVPAVWDDKTKENTRKCAEKAGLGDKIDLISEPEAAVLHAFDVIRGSGLSVGDIFVCCDAGGGTGDLISYEIVEMSADGSIKVREAASGMGDLCGGSFVNNKFKKWLIERFQHEDGYDEEDLPDVMADFEDTKRRFTGDNGRYTVRAPGIRNVPQKNVKKTKLTLSVSEMEDFHSDVIITFGQLVKAQIKATKRTVKGVLLVGGFGQNQYLKREIELVVGPAIEVIQPLQGQEAIARGAVLHGFALASGRASRVQVESRVARRSFGIRVGVPFDAETHALHDRYWDSYTGGHRVTEIDWFVHKGHKLLEHQPIVHEFYRIELQTQGKMKDGAIDIWVCDNGAENPNEYPVPDEIRKHVELKAKLSSIPVRALRKVTGKDGKKYYRIDYEIRFKFFSAHIEYSLWYEDICYGTVDAKYE